MLAAHRAYERSVAKVEDPTVGGNFPIPPTVEGRSDADDCFV